MKSSVARCLLRCTLLLCASITSFTSLASMQVVEGEAATSKVSHWISKNYGGKMHVEVRSVTEDSSSAAAVAELKDDLQADSFIVLSGDLVSDVPLKVHTTANLCFLTNCYSKSVLHIISHANNAFPIVWGLMTRACTQRCHRAAEGIHNTLLFGC